MFQTLIGISEFTSLMMNICSKYAVLRTFVMVYNIWSDEHASRRPTEVIPSPRGLMMNICSKYAVLRTQKHLLRTCFG